MFHPFRSGCADASRCEKPQIATTRTVFAVLVAVLLPTLAPAAVIYDSPARNYVTGITGLVVPDLGATYDVSFVQGSFDDVFGASTTTADLSISGFRNARLAGTAILEALNAETPTPLVASSTPAGAGNIFVHDLVLLPTMAEATYAAQPYRIRASQTPWEEIGSISFRDRSIDIATGVCRTCLAKWAVISPATEIPEPGTLVLFGSALVVGIRRLHRRRT